MSGDVIDPDAMCGYDFDCGIHCCGRDAGHDGIHICWTCQRTEAQK